MSKLSKDLIKGLEETLALQKSEIALYPTLKKSVGTHGPGVNIDKEEPGHERIKADVSRVMKEETRVDKEPDGKQELDYGKEELDKDKKKKMKVDVGDMVDEHEQLVDVLESPSKEDDKKEAKKQKKELKEYKKKKNPVNIDEEGKDKRPNPPQPGDLSKKWATIKKSLSSDDAILDMYEGSGLADEEKEEKEQEEQAAQQEEQGPPEQGPPEGGVEEQDMDTGAAAEEEVQDTEGDQAADEYADENPEMSDEGDEGDEGDEEPTDEEVEQHLQELGLSEGEIAHVMHGHAPPMVDPVDQSKINANDLKSQHTQATHETDLDHKQKMSEMEREHKSRMHDAEYAKTSGADTSDMERDHKSRMLNLEYDHQQEDHKINQLDLEHKKRMLDLEYEKAQRESELDIEAKQKEIEMKLRQKEEQHKDKCAQQKEISGIKHTQKVKDAKRDATQTSKDEKKGLKKFDDVEDLEALEKSMKLWNTKQKGDHIHATHPEHGVVSAIKMKEGGYQVKHNGKLIGDFENPKTAAKGAVSHMTNLTKLIRVE